MILPLLAFPLRVQLGNSGSEVQVSFARLDPLRSTIVRMLTSPGQLVSRSRCTPFEGSCSRRSPPMVTEVVSRGSPQALPRTRTPRAEGFALHSAAHRSVTVVTVMTLIFTPMLKGGHHWVNVLRSDDRDDDRSVPGRSSLSEEEEDRHRDRPATALSVAQISLILAVLLVAFDFQNLLSWWGGRTIKPGTRSRTTSRSSSRSLAILGTSTGALDSSATRQTCWWRWR